MFNKEKFKKLLKLDILILGLIILVLVIPVTLSKYQSKATGKVDSNIALYLLEVTNLSETLKLDNIKPSSDPYTYTFTISNYLDGDVCEVDLEYILSIVTTTNIPLRYELYENGSSTNLINTNNTLVEQDDDGTYFQTFTFDKEYLYYSESKSNEYTLKIYFDLDKNDSKYENTIELVEINVDSSQMV